MDNKIIINPQDTATCPHCDRAFPIREALTHQLLERYETEYDALLAQDRDRLTQEVTRELERRHARQFEARLRELQEQLNESREYADKCKEQAEHAKARAAAQAREEALAEAASLKEELLEKNRKLETFRTAEITLRREKKALEEQKSEMALQLERQLEQERASFEARLSEQFSLKEAQWRKKIADAQRANEDLTRKLEQGSQQLQGEVLELELENLLQQAFPFDQISPVKKGARGADIVQSVHLRSGTFCGKIIWETKRAENWSNQWIPKLKEDQQRECGDLGVLVSTVFPAAMKEGLVLQEGVWLVRPDLVRGLAEALRSILIETQRQKAISTGKEQQMEALFDYICSSQFAQRIRALVESYEEMRSDLEREKSAMLRIWKKRETQIGRMTTQMMNICGELQGISTQALPHMDTIGLLDSEDLPDRETSREF